MSNLTTLLRGSYRPNAFDEFSTAGKFNLGTARALAWMSQLAYETADRDKVSDILGSWQMQLLADGIIFGDAHSVLPIASTHAVAASGRGATILSFAGTDPVSLANWISNFNFRTEPGSTADGFRQAFEAVEKQVLAIARAHPADQPLFVTGHSLGGAVAAIAAQVLQTNRINVAGVYTFGMPRPGSASFARDIYNPALGGRTYRLVHGNDIVPTVAPSALGLHHVGCLLRCDRGGRFDPQTLSADPGLDDPLFSAASAAQLRALINDPGSELIDFGRRLAVVGDIALGRRIMHGRPPSVAVIVESLPPPIRDHLPDCYINALDADAL